MKKVAYLFLLLSTLGFSQNNEEPYTEKIAVSEMKSAAKKINFKVNSNTQNYDITYHKLEFTVNPTLLAITGKVTTNFIALSNLDTVTFELTNSLIVSSVKVNNTNTTFIQNSNYELIINCPSTIINGTNATVEISYSGTPANSGFDSFKITTHGNKSPILWTLSEPYGARDWWPCKQDLNDKIDNGIDIYITAPSQYKSISNGIEQSQTILGSNTITHFKHSYPIPAYLVAIAVSNYQVYNQQGGLGTTENPYFPITNYIYPETSDTMIPSLAPTPTIINFYESIIGKYPFRNEKYGHAEFSWGGGMEHTTVSFMTANNGIMDRSLIAHEMAHQWFGDKVTCGSWKDIWLNEGLTEYMSGCVIENLDGSTSFNNWKYSKINSITSAIAGNLYLYDFQLANTNRIFSSRITYNKGSMVAHMLRYIMGDTNFFQALRNYLNDPVLAYKYALTPQFQTHLEAVHGSSLQEFFNDWVYNEGYPIYTINAYNSGLNQAKVKIQQTQSITDSTQTGYVSYFEMPVPVRLILDNGSYLDLKLNNTFNDQLYTIDLPVGTSITNVIFDPNKDIISKGNTASLTNENFELSASINLFPNPSEDQVYIQLPDKTELQKVRFLNHLGQEVLKTDQKEISIHHLTNGLYQILIETTEGKAHKKFLKK
ncbi:M1 family aminopeptidase [Flavobacterium oreochromis]|uniref:Aminopeptidase N n=1 Tax=Flavobacterium columnare TaxID=996 RepID=A0A246GBQ4_9FLAO|nr:M1 family aminopeptidase [Flavobacterium oreochromis]OWP78156.1 peptidase M1 [Flavobacterium oreochromis]